MFQGLVWFPAGPGGPGPTPQRSGSSPSYQSHKMPLPQYPPSGPPNQQYYKVRGVFSTVSCCQNSEPGHVSCIYCVFDVFVQQDQFNGQGRGLNPLTAGGAAGVYNSFNQPSGVRGAVCVRDVSSTAEWSVKYVHCLRHLVFSFSSDFLRQYI